MTPPLVPTISLIFFQTITILTLAFVLRRYAWEHILAFIKKEEEAYTKAKKEEAAALHKTARLEKTSANILQKAEKRSKDIIENALATKEAILEEAKIEIDSERKMMIQKAKQAIEQQELASFQKVKDESAALIVQVVQKLLVAELSQQNKQEVVLNRLVDETAKDWKKSQP